jgi:NAD(P)H-dependent FMN reductase/cell division protein FtsB
MKFLRFLSLVLATVVLSSPLLAEVILSNEDLTRIGLVEGAQLRIGSGGSWGYVQYNLAGNYHFFNMHSNPTAINTTVGLSNLASIFNVTAAGLGDKRCLWVTIFGSGYNIGRTADWLYVDNPVCTTSKQTRYSVVSPNDLPSNQPGVYQLGFKREDGSYLTVGKVEGSKAAQYYPVEILNAARDTNRGAPLSYENTCYKVSIAGTPLFGWSYTGNYSDNTKWLLFGTVTYANGSPDNRLNSPASYMVILNEGLNTGSYGNIKYGDSVRIIGLHTANNANEAVNNHPEAYPWYPALVENGPKWTVGGRVFNVSTKTPTPDSNELMVIVNPHYAKGTPVCANDSIHLIPVTQLGGTTYPHTAKLSSNLFFAPHTSDWAYASPFVNANDKNATRYNLFTLTAVQKDTTAPYMSIAQHAWDFSAEYKNILAPLINATTITTILSGVETALKAPTDATTVHGICTTKLEQAIPLATTSAQCDQIGSYLSTLGTKGISVTNILNTLQTRKDQINAQQAEKKEALGTSKADEAARVAALKTKDITAMISALDDIINATPINKANVSAAIKTAFTAATSLVKTTADGAALLACFTAAIKKGYVTASARSAFDTRYAQIKTEISAANAFTQKTTLVDLNKALASVVGYKTPITDGFATQLLAGIGKAFGAAKAQWAQVQSLRQSKEARDANAARTTFDSLKAECNKLAAYIKAVASMPLTTAQKTSRNKLSNDLSNFQMTLK